MNNNYIQIKTLFKMTIIIYFYFYFFFFHNACQKGKE